MFVTILITIFISNINSDYSYRLKFQGDSFIQMPALQILSSFSNAIQELEFQNGPVNLISSNSLTAAGIFSSNRALMIKSKARSKLSRGFSFTL